MMKKKIVLMLLSLVLVFAISTMVLAADTDGNFIVNPACGTYLGENASGVHEFEITIPDDKTPQPRPFSNVSQYERTSYDGAIVGMSFAEGHRFEFYGVKPGKCDFKAATNQDGFYNIIVHITVVDADTYYGGGAAPGTTTNPGATTDPGTTTTPGTSEHTHSWQAKTVAATCQKVGQTYEECSVCGAKQNVKTLARAAHTWDNGVVTKAATTSTTGIRTYTCTVCKERKTEVIPVADVVLGEHISGSVKLSKLSQSEMIQLLKDNPNTLPTQDIFDVVPSCKAPYTPGKVKDSVLNAALDRLNALRRIAGLPSVSLDKSLCEESQYGAVIIAATGNMSHYPKQPSDMTDDFYKKAYSSCSTSNLYSGGTLTGCVDGWMNDSQNRQTGNVGHRRWQLLPGMTKIGFGTADKNGGAYGPSAEKVITGATPKANFDYDFIGWPSSGNFPGDLPSIFGSDTCWSVSLNPEKYATPDINSVKVTLTRQSDGKKWNFSGSNYTASTSGVYYTIEMFGVGEGTCIVFRPDNITKYSGDWTVKIDGLKTKSGAAVKDFEYNVTFFNTGLDAISTSVPQPTPGQQPGQGQPGQTGTGQVVFADVTKGHWAYESVQQAYADGVIKGTGQNAQGKLIFSPNRTLTMAEFIAIMTRGFYGSEISTENNTNLWYTPNVNVANNHKLLDGLGSVNMDAAVSRYQMAQIMLNILHDKGVKNPTDEVLNQTVKGISDWKDVGGVYQEAVSVCYHLGMLKGTDSTGAFKGSDTMLRSECATVYLRMKNYLK